MALFDKEDIRLTLEAMKLSQASLQQIMTLSAGGLALFFSFIAKTPFVVAHNVLGILVIVSWISSLCAAIIAHRLHAFLFIALHRLSHVRERLNELENRVEQMMPEAKESLDPAAVAEKARKLLTEERKFIDDSHAGFERTFFPTQNRTNALMSFSLASLICGFIILAVAYVMWT